MFCQEVVGELELKDEKARADNFVAQMEAAIFDSETLLGSMADTEDNNQKYEREKLEQKIATAKVELKGVTEYRDSLPDFDSIKEKLVQDQGIDDARCNNCKNTHGSFSEMHNEALNVGATYEEFKTMLEESSAATKEELSEKINAIAEEKIAEREEVEEEERKERVKKMNEQSQEVRK